MENIEKHNEEQLNFKQVDELGEIPIIQLEEGEVLNTSFDKSAFGEEKWIPLEKLIIDGRCQRTKQVNQIKKIVDNFNPQAFGRIMVSKRSKDDGYYFINDGQHRALALKRLGYGLAPCIVLNNAESTGKTDQELDAKRFLLINENSTAVKAIDKYKIGTHAGLADWMRVYRVIEVDNNLKAGTGTNNVNAVASIYRYINSSHRPETQDVKESQMSRAIHIVHTLAGIEGVTHISLLAMCMFIREYIDTGITTVEKTKEKLNKVDLNRLIYQAQTLKNNDTRGNIITYLAYLYVKEYNNNSRNKLPKRIEI